jgi:hypothetical protein
MLETLPIRLVQVHHEVAGSTQAAIFGGSNPKAPTCFNRIGMLETTMVYLNLTQNGQEDAYTIINQTMKGFNHATVQDIFYEYSPAYLEKYRNRIPQTRQKVIDAIRSCRTFATGMIVYECTGCGKNHHIFRSCGNRHCPTCQNQKGLDWLEHQLTIQVPGPYFMITFTVPENILSIFRSNQQTAYYALFRASSESMKKLVIDEKFIGGDVPEIFGVLHTWGRTLNYHTQIHYVVAGGAWSKDDHIGTCPVQISMCPNKHYPGFTGQSSRIK